MSADLVKLQTELGSNYTYRESEQLFSAFSRSKRFINNHDRIKQTAEQVGGQVGALHQIESTLAAFGAAEELIINIDGGHINTTEEGKRSFEAMTALCDGADNCWQIVDSLTPLCASITRILDWFHLSSSTKYAHLK